MLELPPASRCPRVSSTPRPRRRALRRPSLGPPRLLLAVAHDVLDLCLAQRAAWAAPRAAPLLQAHQAAVQDSGGRQADTIKARKGTDTQAAPLTLRPGRTASPGTVQIANTLPTSSCVRSGTLRRLQGAQADAGRWRIGCPALPLLRQPMPRQVAASRRKGAGLVRQLPRLLSHPSRRLARPRDGWRRLRQESAGGLAGLALCESSLLPTAVVCSQ